MVLDPLFHKAIPILENLEQHGYQAYFVGGSVRDHLLGNSVKDIDIATSATPTEVQAIFSKVIPVGIEHGTVIVRHNKQSYEVTTFRKDGNYSDFRHPDEVFFVSKIDDDLSRRDFTINAMAMNKHGDIHDPFHGEQDIKRQLIRTVGLASDRFYEDPLRMLRALRFVSQLGFSIEQHTLESIKKQVNFVNELAVERLAVEFEKTIAGAYVTSAIPFYRDVNLWGQLPVFKEQPKLTTHVEALNQPLALLYEVFALLKIKQPELDLRQMIRLWKLSNNTYNAANKLVQLLSQYEQNGLNNWLIYQLPESLYVSFIRLIDVLHQENDITLMTIKDVASKLKITSISDVAFTGKDIINLYQNRNKGPWIQSYLNQIEKAIVTGELQNHFQDIKEWILSCHPPEKS
ncbi:CCA-adding enzyme [Paraliobacillus quinghaiensis]|uniref:CCA-adding enzyme n=1 Tax=Paraliobacillus quinghaiensis TaxID=470815 RepID=A0A917TH12_9BACI|nr:CCA tRNA nucleotidyltransferase [Paraliobacillus quinghaiensis]GGM22983.1 CCA-adding enzyme [Paraliobacillus quinghaiensis]